jgi:DNA-binding NarL/FixJ family response regulator
MPAKRYRVSLTESKREQLLNIARRGKSSARKVKRSLILCKADEGLSDQQIAEALLVGVSTVSRVRQRFVGFITIAMQPQESNC